MFGVEVTAVTAATPLRQTNALVGDSDFTGSHTETTEVAARSSILALRVTLQGSLASVVNVVGGFGFARVSFSGPAYEGGMNDYLVGRLVDRTIVGPTVGGRLEVPLTRLATVEFGLSGHFYRMRSDQGRRQEDLTITQQDWLLHTGMAIGLGR